MSLREFGKAGHRPTLLSAFLYFDVSFMVWVILGPLGPFIGEAFHLSASQKGLLTGIPLLGGSFCRPILGWMTERFGGRRTGLLGLGFTLIPLAWGWRFANSFDSFLALGLLLGVAGASFAAALPLASAWYPAKHQGLVMGIAGAGNSGTLLSTLIAPRIAEVFGWHTAFGIAMIPVSAVWVLFFFLAKDAPAARSARKWSDYVGLLKTADTGWFCLLYNLTFGGFVGLTSYLPIFFNDQYALSAVQSGDFTTVVVLCGSFLRPVGGIVADRIGGHTLMLFVLGGAAVSMTVVAVLPSASIALIALALGIGLLGMGNGAMFQLVPQRFPERVAVMTGIVGAAGGLGGFLLPSILGLLKQKTQSFGIGFALLAICMACGAASLVYLRDVWRSKWSASAAQRAGLGRHGREKPLEAYADAG